MPTQLTQDEMKARVVRHFEDFVNNGKPEVIHDNMTPDFLDHDGPGGKPTDAAGDELMMRKMHEQLPDLHLEVIEVLAEADKVMCRNIWRWTDGTSGRPMQFHGFVLWRFEGAKIAERWATVTPPAEGEAWTAGDQRVR